MDLLILRFIDKRRFFNDILGEEKDWDEPITGDRTNFWSKNPSSLTGEISEDAKSLREDDGSSLICVDVKIFFVGDNVLISSSGTEGTENKGASEFVLGFISSKSDRITSSDAAVGTGDVSDDTLVKAGFSFSFKSFCSCCCCSSSSSSNLVNQWKNIKNQTW